MSDERIHRAISDDRTEIAGRVYGEGPPLVFVHGAMDDGKLDWEPLLPFLSDRFTCYVMSTRGRGLSGDNPDHSRERRVEDVTAFVDSVGEPVGLVGLSGGGMLALGAAARTTAISAVAVHEPVVFEVISEETRAGFEVCLGQMSEAAAQRRPIDAVRTFFEFVSNDAELAALSESGSFEIAARHLPVDLREFEEAAGFEGPSPTDPSVLQRIRVPVLLLHGSRTALGWFTDSVRYAAEHLPDARIREVTGAGHLAPVAEPERVAGELMRFFEATPEPA